MNRRWILAILLLALLGALVPASASAHASYVASDPPANGILPTPPNRVNVTLSETIQSNSPAIRVTNSTGVRVESGLAALLPADPRTMTIGLLSIGPGIYTVAWSATSAVDGHFTAGAFSFAVQNPNGSLPCCFQDGTASTTSPPVSPTEIVFRFLSFFGLAIAVGTAAFGLLAWLPAERDTSAPLGGWFRLVRWGQTGALASVVGLAGLWGTLLARGGALLASPYLIALTARLVLVLALVGVYAVFAFSRIANANLETRKRALLVAVALGGAAIAAQTLAGHAAASEALWPLGPASDAAHIAGVYAWIGGLLAILWVRPILLDGESLPFAWGVVSRFSAYAFWAVGLVILGGAGLALVLVGTWDGLVGTAYGWLVVGKISLFAPLLAMGAWNRYRVLPRSADGPAGLAPLVRNVRFESTLAALLLVIAAVLTAIPPAASPAAANQDFTLHATKDGIRFDFTVIPYPTVPGVYTFELLLYNASTGTGYGNARGANLTFTLVNDTGFPQTLPLDGPHGNHFFADSPALARAGIWRIDLLLSRTDGFDISVTFYVTIRGS
ncbi:MAG TPA: CopD family protein [Thermoplasmata archaeon]|nr:CopD family protein [Thermoplasmata archaeon]